MNTAKQRRYYKYDEKDVQTRKMICYAMHEGFGVVLKLMSFVPLSSVLFVFLIHLISHLLQLCLFDLCKDLLMLPLSLCFSYPFELKRFFNSPF